jgi:hypothetical protein
MHPTVKPLRLRIQKDTPREAERERQSEPHRERSELAGETTQWAGLSLPALSFSIVELSR